MRCNRRGQQGFTMVELSIVLVIIGLIVAGVLVGQDLIRGAEVRATVSQLERFSATVNTFRVKYSQIPGDINKAEDFGLNSPDDAAIGNDGDANGLLSSVNGQVDTISQATGEIVNFWFHLSRAKLIEGNFDGAQSDGQLSETFPRTKMNRGGFSVYNRDGVNHFHVGVTNSSGTQHTFANNLKPEEAYGIDVKIDDGLPDTGGTIAITGDFADWENCDPLDAGDVNNPGSLCAEGGPSGDAFCANDDPTPREYNLFSTGVLCQLRVRMN